MVKMTTEDFIERAVSVHGDAYDYSRVVYFNSKAKVEIVCNTGHKNFWKTPESHISRKSGCPSCSGKARPTNSEFKSQCAKVHGGKYTYEKVDYSNNYTKVTVTCPSHGDFNITPMSHKSGVGCSACSGSRPLTTEEFKTRSAEIHGSDYTYEKSVYASSGAKLTVTCGVHGDFKVTPSHHMNGIGCPSCGGVARPTTPEFVATATRRHEGKYTYGLATYTGSKKDVIVTCGSHGNFTTTPNNHLSGVGCPACAVNGYSVSRPGYFYILSDGTTTKVGITNRSNESRLKEITKSSRLNFRRLVSVRFENGSVAKNLETVMLVLLKGMYSQPEGKFDGSTECFLGVHIEHLLKLVTEQISALTSVTNFHVEIK